MPSRIIDAEYLHYCNPSRNSDKVFNIFLVEEDDGGHSSISEYGRRERRWLESWFVPISPDESQSELSGKSLSLSETIARRLIGILLMLRIKVRSPERIALGRTRSIVLLRQ